MGQKNTYGCFAGSTSPVVSVSSNNKFGSYLCGYITLNFLSNCLLSEQNYNAIQRTNATYGTTKCA